MFVLIADDNSEAADGIAAVMRLALDCEIEVAYGGLAARSIVERRKPDAVVVDLRMPDFDGVDLARLVRQLHPIDTPFLIALTGWPQAARPLPLLDRLFDRVFAKPLDVDQLVAVLAGETPHLQRLRQPVPLEAGDMLARAARRVLPMVSARGFGFAYDHRGPPVAVLDDPVELQCGFHRLLLGLVDLIQSGFFMVEGRAAPRPEGGWTVTLDAAGSGPLCAAPQIDAVITRLLLTELHTEAAVEGRLHRSGTGTCPNTGAAVSFSVDSAEGVLLRTTLEYPDARPEPLSPMATGRDWHAWVVDAAAGNAPHVWLQPQLRRLGWRTLALRGGEVALEWLRTATHGDDPQGVPLPDLLVVMERALCDDATLVALRHLLPAESQMVLAVVAGSPRLGACLAPPGVEVRVYPFSPLDVAALCQVASPSGVGSGPRAATQGSVEAPDHGLAATLPAPVPSGFAALDGDSRPDVLLVDDNEINRLVGRGLLEALGCRVRTAHDGLDAIDRCRQSPPQLVLMDLDMGVLGGIEALERLRELQRTGDVAPFAIVAATAHSDDEARKACQRAGFDAFLGKPLHLNELQAHLRRFTTFDAKPS